MMKVPLTVRDGVFFQKIFNWVKLINDSITLENVFSMLSNGEETSRIK